MTARSFSSTGLAFIGMRNSRKIRRLRLDLGRDYVPPKPQAGLFDALDPDATTFIVVYTS
jgi:hypothetical protein